ncbi:MAG: hypothetical protein F4X12_10715 [Acidobacteriia bacterium]|nr:hypothetical protein [Terriglobia bacterium]
MKKWHGHIRGTVRTALTWALLGALAGALIELLNDVLPGGLPMGSLLDVWPPVLAIAGLLGGALVSSALRLAGWRRIQ